MKKPVLNISIGEPLKLLNEILYRFANSRVENILPYCEFYHFDVLEDKVLFYPSKNCNTPPNSLELEQFYFQFNELYQKKVNIKTEAVQLQINLLYGLSTDDVDLLLQLTEMIGEVLRKHEISLNITIICFGESLNSLLHNFSIPWGIGLQTQAKNLQFLEKHFKDSLLLNNILVLENKNLNGIALRLDRSDLIRFLFELNLLYIYHHYNIINSFENRKAYGLGISTLYFDLSYVKRFLALQALCHLIRHSNLVAQDIIHDGQILSITNKLVLDNQNLFHHWDELQKETSNLKEKDFVKKYLNGLFSFLNNTEDLTADHKLAVLAQLAHIDIICNPVNTLTVKDLHYETARYFIELAKENHSYPDLKRQLHNIKELEKKLTSISNKISELPQDQTTPSVQIQNDEIVADGISYRISKTKTNWHNGYENIPVPTSSLDKVDLRGNFGSNLEADSNLQPEISAINHILNYYLRLSEYTDTVFLPNLKADLINYLGEKPQYSLEELLGFYKTYGVRLMISGNPEELSDPIRVQKIQKISSATDIKNVLSEGHVVYTHLKCFSSIAHSFQSDSGIFLYPQTNDIKSELFFYHAIVICGYDSAKGYFIAQSPWGKLFGDKGNLYIPEEYLLEESWTSEKFVFAQIENCKTSFAHVDNQLQAIFNLLNQKTFKSYLRNVWRITNHSKTQLEEIYQNDLNSYEEFLENIKNPLYRSALAGNYKNKVSRHQNDGLQAQSESDRINEEASVKKKKKGVLKNRLFLGGSIGVAASAVLILMGFVIFAIPLALLGIGSIVYPLTLGKEKPNEPNTDKKEAPNQIKKFDITEFQKREKIIDSFPFIQKGIVDVHQRFKEFRENILESETSWKQILKAEGLKPSGPFYSLVQDEKLISYFSNTCSPLFSGKTLFEFIVFTENNNYGKNIEKLKAAIHHILDHTYLDIESKFDLLTYLQGENYPFLPDSKGLPVYSNHVERYSLPAFHQTAVINASAEMGRYLSYPQKDDNQDFEGNIDDHLKITPLFKEYKFNNHTLSLLQFKEIKSLEEIVASNHGVEERQ